MFQASSTILVNDLRLPAKLFATILTLVLTPALLVLGDNVSQKVNGLRKRNLKVVETETLAIP